MLFGLIQQYAEHKGGEYPVDTRVPGPGIAPDPLNTKQTKENHKHAMFRRAHLLAGDTTETTQESLSSF
jgi:hypothetical protein